MADVAGLPSPESVRSDPPPLGCCWVWVEESASGDHAWRAVPPEDARPCRFMVDRKSCRAPSVARLLRGKTVGAWWHYCAQHLYGRIVHDGRVWGLRAVPVEEGSDG